jgi:Holliday junction resolvase
MKAGTAKHDTLCKIVSYHLKSKGWNAITNIEYKAQRCGEIDVLAYKDNYALDIEVKCNLRTKNKRKAIDQLDRAYRFCPYLEGKRVFTLIAYEKQGEIKYEWIKQ